MKCQTVLIYRGFRTTRYKRILGWCFPSVTRIDFFVLHLKLSFQQAVWERSISRPIKSEDQGTTSGAWDPFGLVYIFSIKKVLSCFSGNVVHTFQSDEFRPSWPCKKKATRVSVLLLWDHTVGGQWDPFSLCYGNVNLGDFGDVFVFKSQRLLI